MKKLALVLVILVALGFTAARSNADSITFNLDTIASGTGITPVTSFGTLTLTDIGNTLSLSANLTNPTYKILEINLNFNDAKFSNASILSVSNQSLSVAQNAVKANGYPGMFDIAIPAGGNIGTFGQYSGVIKWNNGSSNLGIADFNFTDTLSQLFGAMHIGNLDGGNSVWVGATTTGTVSVSEPGTLLLLGFGLVSVALFGRKFKLLPCRHEA